MTTDNPQLTCRRSGCACKVESGQEYCGEHCRSSAEHRGAMEDMKQGHCACGHSECGQGSLRSGRREERCNVFHMETSNGS